MNSIVIGSGFGGIAAALRLKAKGHEVTLIEKHKDLGGRARVFKKNLAKSKISQMKEAALNDIKKASISIAVDSVKKAISTSVDKSKLDNLFLKDLEQTKSLLKKINS